MDEIPIIGAGDYEIYNGPPDDDLTRKEDEQGMRCWQLGNGAVLWIYAKDNNFWDESMNLLKPRKKVIPTFCPLPERYPDFPGFIELMPGDRAVIYQVVNDRGTLIRKGFMNIRYEDVE